MTPEELADLLYKALLGANDAMVAAVARQAVSRYAGMEAGRPVGGTYYLYRTLRNLDLDGVLERLVDAARASDLLAQRRLAAGAGPTDGHADRAGGAAAARRVPVRASTSSGSEIENEIRRRLVADRGSEALARSLRKPLPEDIDVMHATRDELVALRKSLQPLSRKLAVRLARKRRHGRKGPLDFRSTVRHSLSTGGVPGRAQVPLSAAVQARDRGDRRHLRFGGLLRPVHPAPGPRHQHPVLQGAQLRVHRRHRRGHPLLRGRRRSRRRGAPDQHRGRRHLGGRPLRLRTCAHRVLGAVGRGDHPAIERAAAR